MNLNHDFVQVSKLNEDQKKKKSLQKWKNFFTQIQVKTKKKIFIKNGTLFSPNSGVDQKTKKRSPPNMERFFTFFPRIQVDTYAQIHTRVKLLGGMQM